MKISITKIIFIFLAIASLPACFDFLDRKPMGQYTEDDYSGGSTEGEVMGLYAKTRAEGICGLQFIAIHSIRSDDAIKGSSLTDDIAAEQMYDYFKYVTNNWLLEGYWTDHYALIHQANNVIDLIETSGNIDPGMLVNKAEAKFMRAYAYFNLIRTFGEVPKIDFKITDESQANIPKSSVSEIYTLIDDDLKEAASSLPATWDPKYLGRLTSGAAKALQAKTFLARDNWAGAYSAATSVIASKVYNLNTPYNKIFKEEGENCSESVFEIQAKYTQSEQYGVNHAQVQGVRAAGNWNLGWGWNTPSSDFANNGFKDRNDPRKAATLLYAGETTEYNETVPEKTSEVPRDYWNRKIYTNPSVRRDANSLQGQWMNVRIIRYADVMLMAAEAANEMGGEDKIKEALGYLNEVRNRAGGGNIVPLKETGDRNILRGYIRDERRAEFGMEYERFFDLVRWGKGSITPNIDVTILGAVSNNNYQIKHRLLPIPQKEIDKSNGVLVQNPDYQ